MEQAIRPETIMSIRDAVNPPFALLAGIQLGVFTALNHGGRARGVAPCDAFACDGVEALDPAALCGPVALQEVIGIAARLRRLRESVGGVEEIE